MHVGVVFSQYLPVRALAGWHFDFGLLISGVEKLINLTWTAHLKNCEIVNLCCFKLPNLWYLLWHRLRKSHTSGYKYCQPDSSMIESPIKVSPKAFSSHWRLLLRSFVVIRDDKMVTYHFFSFTSWNSSKKRLFILFVCFLSAMQLPWDKFCTWKAG